ncbi:hypothetical protein PAHAL_4G085200 [Panicum hallii]|uniref:Uncharacterized protein n=1 Tax=Panicum hallii TaxID=206008 RepID=A0A2S3HHY5_9POAL|nr:hypothetical protein PAHAL_4G085200 [Panicum hallii]
MPRFSGEFDRSRQTLAALGTSWLSLPPAADASSAPSRQLSLRLAGQCSSRHSRTPRPTSPSCSPSGATYSSLRSSLPARLFRVSKDVLPPFLSKLFLKISKLVYFKLVILS